MAFTFPFSSGVMPTLQNNSDLLLSIGSGLLGGRTAQEQGALAAAGAAQTIGNNRKRNRTVEALRAANPQLADAVESGVIDPGEAYKLHLQSQLKADKPAQFIQLADGSYGFADPQSQSVNVVGKVNKPTEVNNITADISARQQAAQQLGLEPGTPQYQSYILTGKMPREDQQPLTAIDKKAILDADEMVQANESAIKALDAASGISDKANSGWLAGSRASLGANLPDWAVPDFVSSPESSTATIDYDNAIVGQALGQLRSIFGGNPTEGERKILLDLQGSANMPAEARAKILQRAKEAAMRRLEFNKQRSNELRGGSFYKQGGGATGTGNRTSNGTTWSIE